MMQKSPWNRKQRKVINLGSMEIVSDIREWSLFMAGDGGKGRDIDFECKQLEGKKKFNVQLQRGKTSVHRFGGGQKHIARLSKGGGDVLSCMAI